MRGLVLALVASGCSGLAMGPVRSVPVTPPPSSEPGRLALTVVLAADVPDPTAVEASLRKSFGKDVELEFARAPNVAAEPPPRDLAPELAAARRAYIDADFRACIDRLGGEALPFDLVAEGQRTTAARVFFWRIACRVGQGTAADARGDARAMAALALDVPADIDAATPEVEALLAEGRREIAARPRVPLTVEASVGGSVSIDGRSPSCVTPCAVDLPAGDHIVRVEAPGWTPASRRVRLEGARGHAGFTLEPATPELAARQWSTRYARGESLDSAASVTLLARAVRARRLALVSWEAGGKVARLRGALAVDGGVAARAERSATAGAPAVAPALLRDLLVRGQLVEPAPSLAKRPLFWIAVGGAVVLAAGITAFLFYDPPVATEVGF